MTLWSWRDRSDRIVVTRIFPIFHTYWMAISFSSCLLFLTLGSPLIRFIYHVLKFTTPGSLIGLIQDLKLMEKVFYVLSLRSEFWSSFSMVSLFHRDCLAPSIQHWWLLARVQRGARMEPPSGNFKRPLNQFKIRNPLLLLKIDGAAAVWLHSKIVDWFYLIVRGQPTKQYHLLLMRTFWESGIHWACLWWMKCPDCN